MPIISKEDLRLNLLSSFPDNNSELITPAILREYLLNFVDSNLSQQSLIINSTPETILDIQDLVLFIPGADTVNLPSAAAYEDRSLSLINKSGAPVTLVPNPGDNIPGGTYVLLDNAYIVLVKEIGTVDWIVAIDSAGIPLNQLSDVTITAPQEGDLLQYDSGEWVNFTPNKRIIQIIFTGKDPDEGDYLQIGAELDSNKATYTVMKDATITNASINRSNSSGADVEIRVNNVVVETLATSSNSTTYTPSIALLAGDELEVRNKNSGSSKIEDAVVAFLMELED